MVRQRHPSATDNPPWAEKIQVFDAEISFQPIIIEVEDTFLNFYNHNLDIPQDLLQTLNEKLGFCFILFKLNVLHKIHKYTKFIRIAGGNFISNDVFFQVKWTPPFEILTAMEGTEFDFSCERFIKAKMKFISLPKEGPRGIVRGGQMPLPNQRQ